MPMKCPWTIQVWTMQVHLHADFFFPVNIEPVFLQIIKLTNWGGGKLWVWLLITICRIKRTGVRILLLSTLFQLPALGQVIYQFLCFWGRDSSMWIFNCCTPNPCIVQGSAADWKEAIFTTMYHIQSSTLTERLGDKN